MKVHDFDRLKSLSLSVDQILEADLVNATCTLL